MQSELCIFWKTNVLSGKTTYYVTAYDWSPIAYLRVILNPPDPAGTFGNAPF